MGMTGEHTWPQSGGDAGVHLLGSARAYFGPQSTISSAGTDGRLMIASDTSRLFGVGSGGTMLLGGSRMLSVGTDLGFTYPQRHYWAFEMGTSVTGSSGTTHVTIPNSGFSGVPFVWSSTSNERTVYIEGKTPTQFVVTTSFNGALLLAPFDWFSVGTRVL
jgi:hypothetical protein